jgi:hypothetical protein
MVALRRVKPRRYVWRLRSSLPCERLRCRPSDAVMGGVGGDHPGDSAAQARRRGRLRNENLETEYQETLASVLAGSHS